MGPVERAIRSRVHRGQVLHTPAQRKPFTVDTLDDEGVVLLLGEGRWRTRLTWACLEGVVPFLAGRGTIPIGGRHEVEGNAGTLDEYLKSHVKRTTAGWVAALLEEAAVVEVIRERPAKVRVARGLDRGGGHLVQRLDLSAAWDDLMLAEDEVAQLREVVSLVRRDSSVLSERGGEVRQSGRGVVVLFVGPPGTGKMKAAGVLANDLGLELYRVDLSRVISRYIGETEKNLRRVFDAAEPGGAILFFDEADALFGERTRIREAHDRYANVEINYLLQRIDDYAGLVILATNQRDDSDPRLIRRIRVVIDFSPG